MNKRPSESYETTDRQLMDTRVMVACKVIDYDESNHTVTVEPAYEERFLEEQNRLVTHRKMQHILDVPVADIAGIRWIPHLIDEDGEELDEHGILIFHDVSIDEYFDTGQIVPLNEESRFHDYADAIYLPFDFRFTNTTDPLVEIKDRKATFLEDVCIKGTLEVDGNVTMHSDVQIDQDVNIDGEVVIDGDANIGGESYLDHEHTETGNDTDGHV